MFSTVITLLSLLPKADGYVVWFDRGYSSFPIAQWLVEHGFGFYMSCTATKPTWLFRDVLLKGLKNRGDRACAFAVDGSMSALAWMDRSPVCILSNVSDPRILEKTVTKKGEAEIPQPITGYRSDYHQVDTVDAFVSRQKRTKHKMYKWYRHNIVCFSLSISLSFFYFAKQ